MQGKRRDGWAEKERAQPQWPRAGWLRPMLAVPNRPHCVCVCACVRACVCVRERQIKPCIHDQEAEAKAKDPWGILLHFRIWETRAQTRGCRANMAHIRQSRPKPGLGSRVKVLETFQAVPSPLGICWCYEPQSESGPLRAVHLSRHKWPGGLID